MVSILHAMLAAILGSGGSAAPAQHVSPPTRRPTIPIVTYGANAVVQATGGVKESTDKNAKVTPKAGHKTAIKVDKTIKEDKHLKLSKDTNLKLSEEGKSTDIK